MVGPELARVACGHDGLLGEQPGWVKVYHSCGLSNSRLPIVDLAQGS